MPTKDGWIIITFIAIGCYLSVAGLIQTWHWIFG